MLEICPHLNFCGGCSFPSLPYEEELFEKEKKIKELMAPFGMTVLPFLAAPLTSGYRSKMEFSFGGNKEEKRLGLMPREKKGFVVDIHDCSLVSPWFSSVLRAVKGWWEKEELFSYFPKINRGHLRTLILREGIRTKEKMVVLTVNGNGDFPIADECISRFSEAVLNSTSVDSLILNQQIALSREPTRMEERVLFGKDHITDTLLGDHGKFFTFKIKASSFFQPNPLLVEKFFALLRQWCEDEELLLDLYSGVGTFGILASDSAQKVIGVEVIADACKMAKENVALNGLANVEMVQADVGKFEGAYHPSMVVIDPPRSGLSPQALSLLLSLNPKKIIYISCNPLTQVRDLPLIIEAGYRPLFSQPADPFPRTAHMENAILLVKEK